jgi:hypothetical protein
VISCRSEPLALVDTVVDFGCHHSTERVCEDSSYPKCRVILRLGKLSIEKKCTRLMSIVPKTLSRGLAGSKRAQCDERPTVHTSAGDITMLLTLYFWASELKQGYT